jgi:hypothetical protein
MRPRKKDPAVQIHRPLRDAIQKIAFYVQSLRLWALELLDWWAAFCGERSARLDVQRGMRDLRSATRMALLISVVARMHIPMRRQTGVMRPFGSPHGFRYRWRRIRFLRLISRGVRLKTLAQIRAALDDFDAVVARALARVPTRIVDGALVMCGVSRAACAFTEACVSPDAADTS